MNCRTVRQRVALLVGGELDDNAAIGVRTHLETCADCRMLADRLRAQHAAMANWRQAEPTSEALDDVRARVLAAIARGEAGETRGPTRVSSLGARLLWPSVGLATAALVACAVWLAMPRPDDPVMPVALTATPLGADTVARVEVPSVAPTRIERPLARPAGRVAPMHRSVGAARLRGEPSSQAGVRRIEIQTADPNIRIIWFVSE